MVGDGSKVNEVLIVGVEPLFCLHNLPQCVCIQGLFWVFDLLLNSPFFWDFHIGNNDCCPSASSTFGFLRLCCSREHGLL